MDIPECIEPVQHVYEDTEIDYVEEPITYRHFFVNYLLPNRPCVLGPWATAGWRSRREWVHHGRPNLDYLSENFGDAEAPTANCGEEEFCSHPKEDKTVKDYIDYIHNYRHGEGEEGGPNLPCLYLKDWHFTRLFPDYTAYVTPVFFQSDWLNEFWDSRTDQEDDYRFVYMGPQGSWTPFHADVFRSYSWSANICGQKKWILFPPGEEELLKDKFGNLVYDVESSELNDEEKFPKSGRVARRIDVMQNSGEIIFVPSGWHHQVHNMKDTISINHNWINGCNVGLCWKYLQVSLKDVQKQIEDCRDMEGWPQQCQLILKASSGIDYAEFYKFIHAIGAKRLEFLRKYESTEKTSLTHDDEAVLSAADDDTESNPGIFDSSKDSDPRIFDSAKESDPGLFDSSKESDPGLLDSSKESDPGLFDSAKDPDPGIFQSATDLNPRVLDSSKESVQSAKESDSRIFQSTTDSNSRVLQSDKESDPRIFYSSKVDSQPYYLTRNHALFDIQMIREVLLDMMQDPDFILLDSDDLMENPETFLRRIDVLLDSSKSQS